jgi:hypothetical protein
MGMAEGMALAFIVTIPTIFLNMPASFIQSTGSSNWAVPVLGGLFSGVLLAAQLFVLSRYSGDLLSAAEKLLGKYAAYAIGFFFWLVFFGTASLWTRQFAESTMLTALPYANFNTVIIGYSLPVMFIVYLGIETLCQATYVMLPFILLGMLLVFAGLTSVLKPLYLLPWQGKGLATLFRPTLFATAANIPVILLLIMAPAFQTGRTIQTALAFGFGGSCILRGVTTAVFIMIFGSAVAAEKMLPFFEMARLIYINKYVQRLEAVFILLWVIVGILAIAACLYGTLYITAKLLRLPEIKPLILPMSVIMTQLASLFPNIATVTTVASSSSYFTVPGVVVITLALLGAALLKAKKKQCDCT